MNATTITRSRGFRSQICSFCAKSRSEVDRLIVGPGVYICNECIGMCDAGIAGRPLPGTIPDWAQMPTEELTARMVRVAQARDQVDDFVGFAVRQLRERGVTWAEIGAALGVTRQAAWDR